MQEDLFGEKNPEPIKKRKTPLKIVLNLNKVCIKSSKSKTGYVCRGIPHSPNVLNRNHWTFRRDWKKAWEQEVWARWMVEKKRWGEYTFPLDFKVKLEVFVFTTKAQDEDNMIGAMKGVIDGLVTCGLLKDDNHDCITSSITFVPVSSMAAEHLELVLTKYVRK